MLRVELLGPPRLIRDGEAVSADTRKALAVIAYLAVEGSATRDNLVGLLWPDSTESRAKGTLRRTLSAAVSSGTKSSIWLRMSSISRFILSSGIWAPAILF